MDKTNLLLKMTALLPVPFLLLSPLFGGSWAFIALFYLSIFTFLADESLIAKGAASRNPGWLDARLANALPILLGVLHFALLPVAILSLANGSLSLPEKAVIFAAFGLFFGTISAANAHELIHRSGVMRPALGKWLFTSLLFGHHVSAHLAIHHRHVATPLDPNTAPLDEGFYKFFNRAWRGSFRSGLKAETTRLALSGRGPVHAANPYIIYCTGAVVFLALAFVLAGIAGITIYLGFALLAQVQLLLSDYVQHYGLRRRQFDDGKFEPVSIRHSWNAPHAFSAALMLNAPKHSDHHAHPSTSYTDLRSRIEDGAPVLPYSVPVMSTIALYPRLWKKVMNPRVMRWQAQQDILHI